MTAASLPARLLQTPFARHLWLATLVAGLVITAQAAIWSFGQTREQAESVFHFRSQTHVLRLQQELERQRALLRDFGALVATEFEPEAVHPLTEDELIAFSEHFRHSNPSLDGLGWSQIMDRGSYARLIAEARAAMPEGMDIPFTPADRLGSGPVLPILYASGKHIPAGRNLPDLPHLEPLVRAALDDGRPRAWIFTEAGKTILGMLQPVSNSLGRIAGMAIGTWELQGLLERNIAHEPVSGLDIELLSPQPGSRQETRAFLHVSRASDRDASWMSRLHKGLEASFHWNYAGLPMRFVSRTRPGFFDLAAITHTNTLLILIFGLLLSGMASRHIHRHARFTEHLQREIERQTAELRAREARFQHLMSVIPDAIGVHQNGRWIYVNPAAVEAFGARDADDLLGSAVLERVHPGDRREAAERIRREIQEGKPAPLKETRLLRLNGSIFYGEVQGRPYTDEAGRPAVLVVMRDISERKQAQQELLALKMAISQAEDSIFVTDASGRLLYANAACLKAFQWPVDDWQGRYAAELRGGRVGDDLYNEIIEKMDQGIAIQRELRFTDTRGEEHVVWRKISPVFDEGQVRWHVCVDHDLTQQRRMQDRIENTHRLESLGVMAGGIAHDFNNLLAAIVGNAGLIERRLEPESPVHAYLSRIQEASEQAAGLCRQMLAYAGDESLELKPVSVSQGIADADQLLRRALPRSCRLEMEIKPDLPLVMADIQKLQQMLLALLSNAGDAVQSLEDEGRVRLRLRCASLDEDELHRCLGHEALACGEYLMLEIQDNGHGMDEDTRNRAFEPFYSTRFTGRGLGLPAALGIIKAHRGGIHLSSHPGVGTRVRVYLPILKQAAGEPAATIAEAGATEPRPSRGPGILIIDDDEMIRDMAAELLADISDTILTAADGDEGLEIFRRHKGRIDVIMLDRTMPRMSGEECLRHLKALDPSVRVIICSGYVEDEDEPDGLRPDAFVHKPFHPEDLFRTIERITQP